MKKILYAAAVLLGAVFVIHSLVYCIPGDPAQMMAGEYASSADVEKIRAELDLDRGFLYRYGVYAANLFRFDFGMSISQGVPVSQLIIERFPATLLLAVIAMLLASVSGIALGVLSALFRGRCADRLILSLSSLFISAPVFVFCILLSLIFSLWLGIFPPSGMKGLNPLYIIMPAAALASRSIALIIRITRNEMVSVLDAQYITAARAMGFPERTVIWRFAMKNILLPVTAVIVMDLGSYLGGAVVTETVFSWPGIGRLLMTAIQKRDIPLMQGIIIFGTIIFIFAGIFLDIMQARLSGGSKEA
ncbi:MAG: ABC transporter permease [Spirochaetota bacterium]